MSIFGYIEVIGTDGIREYLDFDGDDITIHLPHEMKENVSFADLLSRINSKELKPQPPLEGITWEDEEWGLMIGKKCYGMPEAWDRLIETLTKGDS